MAKAVAIGGVFLRTSDPEALYLWYEKHLKLVREAGCFLFRGEAQRSGTSVLSFFPHDTTYMGPLNASGAGQPVMLNLSVEGLDALLDDMQAAGVEVDPDRQSSEYGKFGWFKDPEGNRVELWEPAAG